MGGPGVATETHSLSNHTKRRCCRRPHAGLAPPPYIPVRLSILFINHVNHHVTHPITNNYCTAAPALDRQVCYMTDRLVWREGDEFPYHANIYFDVEQFHVYFYVISKHIFAFFLYNFSIFLQLIRDYAHQKIVLRLDPTWVHQSDQSETGGRNLET
jgi:hypothetical protein